MKIEVLGRVVANIGGLDGSGFNFGGGGGVLTVVFVVLHMGDCDVINHGGLGLFVVVIVAAKKGKSVFLNFIYLDSVSR